jgi:nitrite reductase/ring-hydroxylating ferredoxin subunit
MAVYDLGSLDEFPAGGHRVVMMGRLEIGVFNVDGELYALPNICPHAQGPLCEGPVTGEWLCTAASGFKFDYDGRRRIIVCPWHGAEFDIPTGRCLSSAKFKVRSFPVTISEGRVTVSTDR